MKKIFMILALLLILPISYASSAEIGPFVGDKVMDFTLNDLSGKAVKFSEFRKDKTTLIFFWASWCKDTKAVLPDVENSYEKHDHKKFDILGINTGVRDSVKHAKYFQEENGMTFPSVFDKGSLVSNHFMVMGTPRFFMVNKKGIIVHASGEFPKNLDELLD